MGGLNLQQVIENIGSGALFRMNTETQRAKHALDVKAYGHRRQKDEKSDSGGFQHDPSSTIGAALNS
jgi:hypothetical protein